MKIAIVADLHLNRSLYKGVMDRDYPTLPFRNVDFMRSFGYICDKIIGIASKPDLVVIAGDVYDNHNPSNEIRGFFSKQLYKLSSNNIPVIILVGNHDSCKKHHALSSIRKLQLGNITVIEKPCTINFKDKNLILFPYSLDVEQKNISIKEEFHNFIKKVHEENKHINSLFFGHFGVAGAKRNEVEEECPVNEEGETQVIKRVFINKNRDDISINDLDSIGSDYVFLGDYHRFQVLPTKKCIALYTGSIERTDISDRNQPKGFILYDSSNILDEKLKNCTFIEYTKCRPMIELKGNLQKIQKDVMNMDPEIFKNAVVKISFNGDSSDLSDFTIKLDEIKKTISNKIDPIHIYHVQKVTNEEQERKASKIEKEILEKGHMEASDVEDVVTEMIKEVESDPEERKQLYSLAKSIYNETIEKKNGTI